jgi:hypothetical protein
MVFSRDCYFQINADGRFEGPRILLNEASRPTFWEEMREPSQQSGGLLSPPCGCWFARGLVTHILRRSGAAIKFLLAMPLGECCSDLVAALDTPVTACMY